MFASVMYSFFAFIIAVAVLVIIHEFGHFWVARKCGVKVLRFSIGFGKTLWHRWGRGGTEYVIAAFPLGGYVKLLDEEEDKVLPHELPMTLNRQPVWKKMLIVVAGPVSNLLFAFFAYWVLFTVGVEALVPVIGQVHSGSPASRAMLAAGEEVVSINGNPTRTWQDVAMALLSEGEKQPSFSFEVKEMHSGQIKTKAFSLPEGVFKKANGDLFELMGVDPYTPPIPPFVGQVISHSPAEEAGFKTGDQVLAVEGKSLSDWNDFVGFIRQHPEKYIKVTVLRQGAKVNLSVHTKSQKMGKGEVLGYVGLVSKEFEWPKNLIQKEQYPFWMAWRPAFKKTLEMSVVSLQILGKMVVGEVSLKNLSGPIGVAQGAGESAGLGLKAYLAYLALISISLGILNLLPIPVLDGGRFLYYLMELILRRPLPKVVQEMGLKIGVLLLIGVILLAFYNDISRLL